jgi:dihydropteroate synthase
MTHYDFKNLKTPQVMGILNLTPDSFYDGDSYKSHKEALHKVAEMLTDGANIIDIGAYSSKPNAVHISLEEEAKRLLPVVKEIAREFPSAILSIDTFRSKIAEKSVDLGAHIINDISGGNMDKDMFQTVARLQVPYILMHMQGTPKTMQQNPIYVNVTNEIKNYFKNKLTTLQKLGVNEVILDVGFGFGKTIDQNYKLLHDLGEFQEFEKPILVGLSRKSMLYKVLETTPDKALNATSIAHTMALLNGASILRVHDVKDAIEAIKIYKQYKVSIAKT